jgi:hypothetical protein
VAWHGKLTTVEIAAQLGRGVSSVYQLFFRLGLTKARWTKEERRQLREYIRARYAEEWSDTEIAVGWSAEHPDRTVDRGWVSEVRREKLHLPSRGVRRNGRVGRASRGHVWFKS